MGYQEALEAAGAQVHAYKEFGSYQGDWLAKVTFEGETFWLRDYFGSCSGCDAFEAEIGYLTDDDGQYIWDENHPKRRAAVAEFGRRYLQPQERLTREAALKAASENLEWDSDAQEMVDFINENSETR